MEINTDECFLYEREMGHIEHRRGRGQVELCNTCDSDITHQCRQMTVTLPDNMAEQIESTRLNEQPAGNLDDATSIEAALDDVAGVGSTTIQHLRENGFIYMLGYIIRSATTSGKSERPSISALTKLTTSLRE